jgi:hypothetical protein
LAHFFPSLRAFIDDQTHIVELVLEQRSRQSGLDKVLRAVVHEHLHLSVLISALALHMQVQAECVRLFEMDRYLSCVGTRIIPFIALKILHFFQRG